MLALECSWYTQWHFSRELVFPFPVSMTHKQVLGWGCGFVFTSPSQWQDICLVWTLADFMYTVAISCESLCVLVLSESSITPGSAHLSASLSTEGRSLIKTFHFGMSISESLSALFFNYGSLCPLTFTAGRNFSEEVWTIHQSGWQPSVDLTIDCFPSSIICIATSRTMKVSL